MEIITRYGLTKPFVLVDTKKCEKNISFMADKCRKHNISFRPHFKTHRSHYLGELFRKYGVTKITVSSVDMADYFVKSGWNDILIAFPVNIHEIPHINKLSENVDITLLADNIHTLDILEQQLDKPHKVKLKINTGYNRSGVYYNNYRLIEEILGFYKHADKIIFDGILTHNGETYNCKSKDEILIKHNQSVERLNDTADFIKTIIGEEVNISAGDTPGAVLSHNFTGIDELRPGNFIFYDWMQYRFGVCDIEDIAIKAVLPVTGVYNDPARITVMGGAVHLSKDYVLHQNIKEYGACLIENKIFSLTSLSQEHGVILLPENIKHNIKTGDWLEVYPAHSCLTADLYNYYYTTDGEKITAMEKHYGS